MESEPGEQVKVAVLASGAFNPITNLHLRMFEAARDYLQKKGNFTVVAGIISPISHDNKKQELVSSRHRVEMCKISLQDSKWIRVDAWESTQDGHVRPLNLLRHHKTALERRFKISSPCCTQPVKNQNKPLPPPPNINKELNGKPIGWYKYGVDILQNFCCPAYLDQENQNTDDAQQIEIPKKKGITVLLLCSQEMLEAFAKPGVWRQNEVVDILKHFGLVCIARDGFNPEQVIYESDVLSQYKESIHIVTDWIENEIIPTKVRRALRRKQSVKYLLPDGVINYIRKHKLYQTKTTDDNANVIRITDNRDITIPVDESIMPYQTDNKTFYKDNRTASKEDIDEEEEEEVKMTLEDVAVKVTAIERRVREFDMRVREVEDAVNGKFDLYNRSSFYSEESGLGDSMSEGDVDDITELTDEEEDENNTDSEKVMKWTRPSVHLGAAERLEVLLKESKEATCFSGKKDMHVHFAADVDEGFTSPTDKLHRDIYYSKDYLPKRIRKTRLDPLDKDSENRYMSLRKCRLEAALGSTDKLNNNLHFVLEPPGRAQPATCKAERSPPAEAKPNNDNVEDPASGSQQLTAERKSPRYHGKISPSKEFYMWGIKFCSSESLDEEANRERKERTCHHHHHHHRRHARDSQEPRQQGDGQDGQTTDLDPDTEKKVDTPDANKKDEATSMEKQSQLEAVQPEKKEDGVGISGIPEVRITNHSPTVEPEEEELNQVSHSTGGTDKEEAEEAEKSRDIDQTTENVAAAEEGATAEYTTEQQKKRASLKLDFSVKSPRKANSETVWHLIESDKKSFTVMVDDVDKRLTGAIGDPTWV